MLGVTALAQSPQPLVLVLLGVTALAHSPQPLVLEQLGRAACRWGKCRSRGKWWGTPWAAMPNAVWRGVLSQKRAKALSVRRGSCHGKRPRSMHAVLVLWQLETVADVLGQCAVRSCTRAVRSCTRAIGSCTGAIGSCTGAIGSCTRAIGSCTCAMDTFSRCDAIRGGSFLRVNCPRATRYCFLAVRGGSFLRVRVGVIRLVYP